MFVLPFMSELEIIYQVTDNTTVQKQTHHNNSLKPFQPYLIWKSRFVVKSYRVLVPVHCKLILYSPQSRDFQVFAGPGSRSSIFLWRGRRIHLPTFQALLILVEKIDPGVTSETPYVKYGAQNVSPYNIHVSNFENMAMPQCSNEVHKNKHCVYNITTEHGYVNVSIIKLTYIGPDFKYARPSRSSDFRECMQGGVAFSLEMRNNYFSMKHLCHNYSSYSNNKEIENNYDKPLMNIISGTKDGLLFVVYAFDAYSEVIVDATVSATPCEGLRRYRKVKGEHFNSSRTTISDLLNGVHLISL